MQFKLYPHPSHKIPPDIQVTGDIERDRHRINLSYQLKGNLQNILIPPAVEPPTRQDELWKQTCLECFLGVPGDRLYWEFNLSPSGHWNVYHFEGYRQGMQAEMAIAELPFQVNLQAQDLTLSIELDLETLNLGDRALEVAMTAVIQDTDKTVTYWALTHQTETPDFHQRGSFILKL